MAPRSLAAELLAVVLFCAASAANFQFGVAATPRRTVVVVLVDDLDDTLTPLMDVMPKMKAKLKARGVTFQNSFVTTPVCCPSRSSYMTGLYQHNHKCLRNSISGGCASPTWKASIEPHAFAPHLLAAGWSTGFFGKYLNQYAKDEEGVAHVPGGWTRWLGLRGNSVYYDYTLSNGGKPEKHGHDYASDYLVDLLANRSIEYLKQSFEASPNASVLAMIATPAAHNPYDPAPQYAANFDGEAGKAPRTANWNVAREGKHWLVGDHMLMGAPEVEFSDLTYRRRLMTLQSLDDLVGRLFTTLEEATNRLDSSYFFFASDNGFHSGQWTMPDDKRLPYETDIRTPLIVHAPGMSAPSSSTSIVLNIDLGPTLLELAGLRVPSAMDGTSYAALLARGSGSTSDSWTSARESFLVEYHGEDGGGSDGKYSKPNTHPFKTPPHFVGPKGFTKMQDCLNNTYSCVRTINGDTNDLFCEFFVNDEAWLAGSPVYLEEYYDVDVDPLQMNNTVSVLSNTTRTELRTRLNALRTCSGASECQLAGVKSRG